MKQTRTQTTQMIKLQVLSAGILALGVSVSVFAQPLSPGRTSVPASPDSTNVLSLEEVMREVFENNPAIKAARANWEAMKQRVPQARAWQDLRGGVDVERSGTTRFGTFTDNEWMLMQEIPITGKNRLHGKAALAEAATAFEDLRRRELDVAARARGAYYRLGNAYEQLNITDRNIQLLKQFVEISRTRYATGTKPESDVLIAETDLSKLEEARFDVLRQVSDAESQLNVLMNRRAQQPLRRPASLPSPELHLALEPLQALAVEHRPELLSAQQKIKAAQARYQVAKRQWLPDPEIRVEARQFNGMGGGIQEYDTGVFFNFPWLNFGKYRAAAEEAKEMRTSAEHELEGARKETMGVVRDALKKVETFHHHVILFRDRVVPLARQNVTATRLAYETDRANFLNLIDAQRTLQEVESMYWNHLTEYLSGLAELEAAVGAELSKIQPQP